jgi:hypothetical protein
MIAFVDYLAGSGLLDAGGEGAGRLRAAIATRATVLHADVPDPLLCLLTAMDPGSPSGGRGRDGLDSVAGCTTSLPQIGRDSSRASPASTDRSAQSTRGRAIRRRSTTTNFWYPQVLPA